MLLLLSERTSGGRKTYLHDDTLAGYGQMHMLEALLLRHLRLLGGKPAKFRSYILNLVLMRLTLGLGRPRKGSQNDWLSE
jgi:hypothetical protein